MIFTLGASEVFVVDQRWDEDTDRYEIEELQLVAITGMIRCSAILFFQIV